MVSAKDSRTAQPGCVNNQILYLDADRRVHVVQVRKVHTFRERRDTTELHFGVGGASTHNSGAEVHICALKKKCVLAGIRSKFA